MTIIARITTKTVVVLSLFALVGMGYITAASAVIIGTGDAIRSAERQAYIAEIDRWMAHDVISKQLSELGVDAGEAMTRAKAMTHEELAMLVEQLDQLPAGGGVIEVIGIVFVVLLILELVGITDIFKKL